MSKSLKKLIDINRLREFKNKLVGAGSAYVQTSAVDQTIAGTKTFSKPIVGSVTGSSGSCTGNAATATRATSADRATNADHATRATQDSDGNKITTTYSKVGHTHDDRYYTETEVNNLLGGKANTSGTYSNLTVGNAGSATNATYANWLRTSSNSDYLFHTEWDGGYFWTYVTAGDGSYRPVRVARSDSAATAQACTGNATSATKLQTARTINGTSFNGTANITTANWGTARNISITDGTNTSTAVSVNGSANVSLKLPATIKANLTGNSDTATKATQDSDGNQINTTYSKVGHTHDDRYYTETEVNNLLNGKANSSHTHPYIPTSASCNKNWHWSGQGGQPSWLWGGEDGTNMYVYNPSNFSVNYANSAGYANWLRTSSHSDHLFHTEWDNAGYFWTYVTAGNGDYRAVRVARSDSAATAQACTGNAATATKATQDAAGNTITTTYATKAENNTKANNSEVVHKSGDETIAGTKTFNDTVHASGFHATAPNALMAQRDGYTLVLRNDGDNTYLLMSDKGGVPGTWNSARPLVISNSRGVCDINGNAATATTAANADHATSADSATKAIILKSNSSAYHEIRFDWSRQVNGRVGIRVDAVDLGGIATTSGTYGGMTVGSATRATQDSDGHQISTTYIKRTDAVSYNIGACFIGFYSSASHISNIGNGGRLAVGATTSASNLYDTITTTNSNTVVCSRNITLAGVWKLISVIKYNVFSENYAIVESTRQAGSSFAAGVVAVQGLFIRVS